MNDFKFLTFKSDKNVRIQLERTKKNSIYITVIRVVDNSELKEFPYFKVLRKFSKCSLIISTAGYKNDTFALAMMFAYTSNYSDFKKHEKIYFENGLRISFSRSD
jgi:hypothetical protein